MKLSSVNGEFYTFAMLYKNCLSPHVENIVLLSKLKGVQSIEVQLDLDEMDLTEAESKATYAEIRQWPIDKEVKNETNN